MMVSLIRMTLFLFFFSSRRRHTRCLSDWSSDVCSSDLPPWRKAGDQRTLHLGRIGEARVRIGLERTFDGGDEERRQVGTQGAKRRAFAFRSEERRVGKECRYRGETEH